MVTKMFRVVTLLVFNYGIDFTKLWQYALHCAITQYATQFDILQFVILTGFYKN